MTLPLAQLGDAQLMAAVQQGGHPAFATLVTRHHARCFALAWRVLGDRTEAEDAVQDAFVKLWNNKLRYDPGRGNFGGWLTRIVTNAALDRRRMVKDVATLEDAGWVADERPTADRIAESNDLHQTMATMPPRQRAAITLFYLEGFSMVEVAKIMGSNVKAVESMLSRGRAALKALLAGDRSVARGARS